MHLGNVFAALIAWLSVRSRGGEFLLRMEDLDIARTRPEYARDIRRELEWLGLDWDRETPPQSARTPVYGRYFQKLEEMGLVYPCYCSRSLLHSVDAPHASDGTYIYPGFCASLTRSQQAAMRRLPAWRLRVPQQTVCLTDLAQGAYSQELSTQCGDFLIRRADGVYMYQLAVTVDDGEAGVTQVVRGADLLGSAPRQMYLQSLLGFPHPEYGHVPLLLAPDGRRLSKRDRDLDLGELKKHFSPEQIIGSLAHAAGLLDRPEAISAQELACHFRWDCMRKEAIYLDASLCV